MSKSDNGQGPSTSPKEEKQAKEQTDESKERPSNNPPPPKVQKEKWWKAGGKGQEKSHEWQQGQSAEYAGVNLPERKQQDESTIDWLARSLGKPKHEEFAEMTRWVSKTALEDNITEHNLRWIENARPILDKIDQWKIKNSDLLQMKRTILLVVAADYMNKPRHKVFKLDITATETSWKRWMTIPRIRSVYEEIYSMMESEIMAHELAEVRKATRITRISAGRAAEVRTQLLEHPNPWVQLQAARDIMQGADRSTAAKGPVSVTLKGELSEGQMAQLMDRATKELNGWDELGAAPGTENGRPVVILDQTKVSDDQELPVE